ncbi:MAG: secondary thiamine-phosphate synthase enzyme YjbQ [bacterium]|jgi:secondary thiamine-phosphate synthase enzyme
MLIELKINTKLREDLIDITDLVLEKVEQSGIKNGIAVIFVPHTTAAVLINENADPMVKKDIIEYYKRNVPSDYNYHHLEGNSDSHIKSSLIGNSLTLIIQDSKVLLGSWQGIFFCEFDGPRTRKVYIKILQG